MATVNLGSIKFKWKGTYSGATAYTVDDVVSYNGSSYICILASTGNLPTNATYFEQMAQAGTNGTNGTDINAIAGLQVGDILTYNGTSFARLEKGTANQVLRVNSGATGLEYGTIASGANAGEIIQVLSASDTNTRNTTSASFVTASNTLSVTITPSSASNQIFVMCSFMASASYQGWYTIFRDSTNLDTNGFIYIEGQSRIPGTITFLDSPNTTSPTTYQLYMRQRPNPNPGESVSIGIENVKQVITVMEIKG